MIVSLLFDEIKSIKKRMLLLNVGRGYTDNRPKSDFLYFSFNEFNSFSNSKIFGLDGLNTKPLTNNIVILVFHFWR